jgi:hypothetical protein
MIIDKIFETQINLTDINDIFNNNLDELLVNKLNNQYVNKCYKSSYILSINKIINRSIPTINKRSLAAYINIYIVFEASVLHYDFLDIILDNEVIDTSNSRIICKSENKSILINNKNKILDSIKVNQLIPIIVGKCSYTLYKNTISINSYPFIPILENKNNIYYIIDQLTNDDIELLNSTIILDINNEIKLKNDILKVKNNKWEYFNKLLYPYKELKYNKNIPYIEDNDLLKLNSYGIVSLLNEQPLIEHNISVVNYDKYKKNNKNGVNNEYNGSIDNPISENALVIYQIYLIKFYKHLKLLRELTESYQDEDKFNTNQNVFDIYEKNKL